MTGKWILGPAALAAVASFMLGCVEAHEPSDAGSVGDAARLDAALSVDASSVDGGPDAAIPVDAGPERHEAFATWCEESTRLVCEGNARCCSIADRTTMGSCESPTRRGEFCDARARDPALLNGRVVWQPEVASADLVELEAALEGCSGIDRSVNQGTFLVGTLGRGEDCTPAGPLVGWPSHFACEDGLRCELTGTLDEYEGRCTDLGDEGETCLHQGDCAEGLHCRATPEASPAWGTCERWMEGEPCQTDLACPGQLCEPTECVEPEPGDTWCTIRG